MKKISLIFTIAVLFMGCKKFEEWGAADSNKIPMGTKQSMSNISKADNEATFKYVFGNVSKVSKLTLYRVKYKHIDPSNLDLIEGENELVQVLTIPSKNDEVLSVIIKNTDMSFYLATNNGFVLDQSLAYVDKGKADFVFIIENNEGYKQDEIKITISVTN